MDTPKPMRKHLFSLPARIISVSFFVVILTGTLLLMLPISNKDGVVTSFVDALYTATSATCVTGLIVYDTYAHWTIFGQCVILALIQIGGLGLVTLTSFFNIVIGKKMGLRSMHLAQESVSSLGQTDIAKLIKTVIMTALIVELAGAALLATSFIPKYGAEGIFISIFLSVSAFCNAGFDILGREGEFCSLMNYNGNPVVMYTIMLLIIIGGIGFIVIHDVLEYRKTKKLTLHTRVVLIVTGILIVAGTLVFALSEWNNPSTIGSLPGIGQKFTASLFQSVSCRTAGFNSIDLAAMHDDTKVFSSILMFFGAAPGSTGGGIKITTLAVIFMTVVCVAKGYEDTIIMHRKVDKNAVYKSLAVLVLAMLVVTATTAGIIITMSQEYNVSGVDAFFEAVSGFATVGLSVGISQTAPVICRFLLIFSMFVGRVGPVAFVLSMAMRPPGSRKEIIPEGKIMIG